ncbi:MAG TPA: hypothetical protein VMM85_03410 [Methylomirabilota bacterium]|nr:hypothetical protein [Methylomirabilota bacterium]
MSVVHRVRLPVDAVPTVAVGDRVEPAEVLATRRPPGTGRSLPVAEPLFRSARSAADCIAVQPGTILEEGDLLAADGEGREVRVPQACLLLGYDTYDGTAMIAPLGGAEPILGHVRGEVSALDDESVEVQVAGSLLTGIGGYGGAVHGELRVAVHHPTEELRAASIDVGATGRIVVGGSRASAETLTRARAMGVAGIVLGGVLDRDLRDFETTQARRRDVGGMSGEFAVLVVAGFGKVGLDPALFAWLVAHDGHMASLFGEVGRLYVYDASPPPSRRALPRAGDRVIAHRRPHAGASGELLRVLDGLHAVPSGLASRCGLVRFEDGLTAIVPLANLEATEPLPGS